MVNLKPLVQEALSYVTPHNWMQAMQHAEQLQKQDRSQDIAVDHFVESFVINTEESSDEDMSD